MTRQAIILFIAAAFLVGGCGSRSPRRGPLGDDPDALTPMRAMAIYTEALDTVEKQGCGAALDHLTLLSSWGRGFEVAQYHLGACYIDLAQASADPAARTRSLEQAYQWLALAANSNNVDAQGKMVEVCLHGLGTDPDPIEAGKWYVLNQRHGVRREIGAKDLPPSLVAELQSRLTPDDWRQANARADAFEPIVQDITAPYKEPEKATPGMLRRRAPLPTE